MLVAIATPQAVDSGLSRVATNVGFARAVMEGRVAGRAWADGTVQPAAFHALHPYGMSLVWGDGVDRPFDRMVEHLRRGTYRAAAEWLQVDPRWHGLGWADALGAQVGEAVTEAEPSVAVQHTRVNFTFEPEVFAARNNATGVPSGWTPRRATPADFALQGTVVPSHFWPDAETFIAQGGGWCMVRGAEVGATAFTSFRFGDALELGIETMPAARRQGLGFAVAAAMIADLMRQGIEPIWSCRKQNTASVALARRLGFRIAREDPYYRLPPGPF